MTPPLKTQWLERACPLPKAGRALADAMVIVRQSHQFTSRLTAERWA
jgi:hypothetical protein